MTRQVLPSVRRSGGVNSLRVAPKTLHRYVRVVSVPTGLAQHMNGGGHCAETSHCNQSGRVVCLWLK